MKTGQVVLYKNQHLTPIDFLMGLFTHRFAHCAIVTDAANNRAISAQELHGVALQYAAGSDAQYADVGWNVPFEVVEQYLTAQLGKRYDWWAWVRIALGLKSPCPADIFTCSSLVGQCLTRFATIPNVGTREVTPDDIAAALGV